MCIPIAAVTNYYKLSGIKKANYFIAVAVCIEIGFTGLTSGVSRRTVIMEAVGDKPILHLLQLPEATCIPWLVVPSFILNINSIAS